MLAAGQAPTRHLALLASSARARLVRLPSELHRNAAARPSGRPTVAEHSAPPPGKELPLITARSSAFDTVEAEVRELVRRRGLDPVEDRAEMRRLIDDIVTDYDERTLTSSLPALLDPRSTARAVYDAVAGFGPLQRHLDDPEVEEIWIDERLTDGWHLCAPPRRCCSTVWT